MCPLRSDQSSTPSTRGGGEAGMGARRSKRSSVWRLDRHQHVFALTSRRSASQFFGDGTESAGLSIGAARMGRREIVKRLGKSFARTRRIGAEKSTYLDTKPNGIVHQGHVCQGARIPTVNLHRCLSTVRTRHSLLRATNRQEEGLAFTSDLLKQQIRVCRKQQGGYG